MKEIIDDLVFALYLNNYNSLNNNRSYEEYLGFKEEAVTHEHNGDCTWDSEPCIRCIYEELFKTACGVLKVLYNEGWTIGDRNFSIIHSVKKEDKLANYRDASKRKRIKVGGFKGFLDGYLKGKK